MTFKQRPRLFQLQIPHILHKDNGVGIPHGHAGHTVCNSSHPDGNIHRPFPGNHNRNPLRIQYGTAHVHPYQGDFVLLVHRKFQMFDLSRADNGYPLFVRKSFIIHIFRHAADSVAAHFGPGPVRVVHLHLKIGRFGRIDKDNAIASYAEMPVAQKAHHPGLILLGNFPGCPVNIDIIVAASMHLGKFHPFKFHLFWPPPFPIIIISFFRKSKSLFRHKHFFSRILYINNEQS